MRQGPRPAAGTLPPRPNAHVVVVALVSLVVWGQAWPESGSPVSTVGLPFPAPCGRGGPLTWLLADAAVDSLPTYAETEMQLQAADGAAMRLPRPAAWGENPRVHHQRGETGIWIFGSTASSSRS